MFSYCENNPVMGVDPNGEFLDTIWDVISLGMSVAEVVANPTDPWAWASLAGDIFDVVVPGVSGVGEAVSAVSNLKKASKAAKRIASGADNIADGAKATKHAGGLCFVEGTLVHTETGNIPIEEIEIGNLVWAWDEETGQAELKPVVETYVNETTELTHVFVSGEEIISTPSHPFYSPVKGWTAACKLRAGDILQTVNGEYVVIEWVQHELLDSPIKVYNFEVYDLHTYFVGEYCLLVHNRCTNPYGKLGGNKHQTLIGEIGDDLSERGYKVTYEHRVTNIGGYKDTRYIDIYATKGYDRIAIQVGRQTKGGLPVARERRAISDLESAGYGVLFIPYR